MDLAASFNSLYTAGMDSLFASDSGFFAYVALPLFIFAARATDVSLATLRVVFISRSRRLAAAVIGFFEILIWLAAISQILANIDNILYYLAYAGGFAAGTYAGLWIESKLALGSVLIRVATRSDAGKLIDSLKQANYGVTSLQGQGATGPVHLLFTLVKRQNAPQILRLIQAFDPMTFYSIEDVRQARDPIFPLVDRTRIRRKFLRLFKK